MINVLVYFSLLFIQKSNLSFCFVHNFSIYLSCPTQPGLVPVLILQLPRSLLAAIEHRIVARHIIPQSSVLLHLDAVLVGVVVGLVLVPVGVGPGVAVDPGEVGWVVDVIPTNPEVCGWGQTCHKRLDS